MLGKPIRAITNNSPITAYRTWQMMFDVDGKMIPLIRSDAVHHIWEPSINIHQHKYISTLTVNCPVTPTNFGYLGDLDDLDSETAAQLVKEQKKQYYAFINGLKSSKDNNYSFTTIHTPIGFHCWKRRGDHYASPLLAGLLKINANWPHQPNPNFYTFKSIEGEIHGWCGHEHELGYRFSEVQIKNFYVPDTSQIVWLNQWKNAKIHACFMDKLAQYANHVENIAKNYGVKVKKIKVSKSDIAELRYNLKLDPNLE